MRYILIFLMALGAFSTSGQSFFSTVSGKCEADSPVELGIKFTTTQPGYITGLRFYKCSAGTQVYTLKLYSGTVMVASGVFQGSATGWQTVTINPYRIVAGVTYTATYYTAGVYQAISTYAWPVTAGPLRASGSVYLYKPTNNNTLPFNVYLTSNYFMDVVYQADTTVIPPTAPQDSIMVNGELYVRAATIKPPVKDTILWPYSMPDSSTMMNVNGVNYKVYYFTKYNYDRPQDTVYLPDTSQVILAWDGVDSVNYESYLKAMKYMKILEVIVLPDPGHRWRYVEYIDKVLRKEESLDGGKTWKRLVPSIND